MDAIREQPHMTAGLDLGDKYSYLCLIDTQSGEVVEEGVGCALPLRPSDAASTPSSRCASLLRQGLTRPGLADCSRSVLMRCW
jgi:hypothetical protein